MSQVSNLRDLRVPQYYLPNSIFGLPKPKPEVPRALQPHAAIRTTRKVDICIKDRDFNIDGMLINTGLPFNDDYLTVDQNSLPTEAEAARVLSLDPSYERVVLVTRERVSVVRSRRDKAFWPCFGSCLTKPKHRRQIDPLWIFPAAEAAHRETIAMADRLREEQEEGGAYTEAAGDAAENESVGGESLGGLSSGGGRDFRPPPSAGASVPDSAVGTLEGI